MHTPPVYRLEAVTKRLEKAGSIFTLHIPALSIQRGEFTAFVGASGCGKSTLLDLLGLISLPTSAGRFEVRFQLGDGNSVPESVAAAAEARVADLRRRHLGYVLQSGGLLPFLTVGENILLSRRINGQDVDDGGTRALAEELEIATHWHKKPAFLSGGQRQRVAIARALAHHPTVLLADEPTGAVDKTTARKIYALLRRATRERDVSVLSVTHDEQLVANLTDRVFSFRTEAIGSDAVESELYETDWSERMVAPGGSHLP
jgi:putative ABC transport system ATP-binding protein